MTQSPTSARARLPRSAGIGLRDPHHAQVLASPPAIGWFEVHSENFFGQGGAPVHLLETVRAQYPVSLHGVGLSLGSADPLSELHLKKLKKLVARIEPAAVSEHLCWSSVSGHYLNDLLPLPYSNAALEWVAHRIDAAQEYLGRQLLIENISSYLQFRDADMSEWDFVAALARRTGCGLLLDVNNVYVSACNHGFDAMTYINAMPAASVMEIHLAGHEEDAGVLVDTHSRPVCAEVWDLYEQTLGRLGKTPTLIEWDSELPALQTLLDEAAHADALLAQCRESAHV